MDNESDKILKALMDALSGKIADEMARTVHGRVGIDIDDNVCFEAHIDNHAMGFMVDTVDDVTYSLTFVGGRRNDEVFYLENHVIIVKDEVDALVKIPEAIITHIPELKDDVEILKDTIHKYWIEPCDAIPKIADMRLQVALEEGQND